MLQCRKSSRSQSGLGVSLALVLGLERALDQEWMTSAADSETVRRRYFFQRFANVCEFCHFYAKRPVSGPHSLLFFLPFGDLTMSFKPLASLSLITLAALAAAAPAQAAIAVADATFAYSQTFDTLAASGTSVAWANDSTLAGWSLFNKDKAAITSITVDNGGSNAGAFRSYGSTGSTDRALGGAASGNAYFGNPASGAIAGWIAVAFTNTSAKAFSGFNIAFEGEQWRDGGAASPVAQKMSLEYGFGASFATVSNWTAPGASFDWASPVKSNTGSGAAVNGNTAGKVTGLGGTVTTPWAANDTLWVRWVEKNDAGNDHGLAIDNVNLTVVAAAVPEPSSYAMLLAGLCAMGFVAKRRKA